jgi:hypothetical protein
MTVLLRLESGKRAGSRWPHVEATMQAVRQFHHRSRARCPRRDRVRSAIIPIRMLPSCSSCKDMRAPICSDTRTSMAAIPDGRAEGGACPMPTTARSRSNRASVTTGPVVPLRHPADRLDRGGECRYREGRHGRGVGLRPSRPDHEPAARGRARDRDRPRSGAPSHGPGGRPRRDHRFLQGGRLRAADGEDGRRGPDSCIDAVGAEARSTGSFGAVLDNADSRSPRTRQGVWVCPILKIRPFPKAAHTQQTDWRARFSPTVLANLLTRVTAP